MKKCRLPAVIATSIIFYFTISYSVTASEAANYCPKNNVYVKAVTYSIPAQQVPAQQPSPKPKTKKTKTGTAPVPNSYHTVTTATLNVRSKPSLSSSIVKKLKYKDKVIIIETTDAKWVKIQAGKVTGYTYRKSLSLW